MNLLIPVGAAGAILIGGIMVATAGWDLPPTDSVQYGYRGTGMEEVLDREDQLKLAAANALPEGIITAPTPEDRVGPKVRELPDTYKNVQLLGDLTEAQFLSFMTNISAWVAPQEGDNAGCAYCHNLENMADDSMYTHKVARRMIQMNWTINSQWKQHVGTTGVVCYTCHRGQPVPRNIWFKKEGPSSGGSGWMGFRDGQNLVATSAGYTSLPYDSLSMYLEGDNNIRVHTDTALPSGNPAGTKDAEKTYALMMHMSNALGVNCTFCHNSRAFNVWAEGPATRVTAWHGIRMTRSLNQTYLVPLQATYPPNRLGPLGDAPKVNCSTCHQGANKPLLGVSMLKDVLPEFGGPDPAK
jgi:photosynthetic reaction center cytochrome c subunit